MEAFNEKECIRKILLARMRLTSSNGFYGLLLMHARFALDFTLPTAATDGDRIFFSPKFLKELSDTELDFVLMHEIMHIALKHCFRYDDRDNALFNIACDIVVNSNILKSCDMDKSRITLKKHGELMHLTPDGQEGYLFTAEQVYNMLLKSASKDKGKKSKKGASGGTLGTGIDGKDSDKSDSNLGGKLKKDEIDSHDYWGRADNAAEWDKWVSDAAEAMANRSINAGDIPLGVERRLRELKRPTVDWRTVLADFVQEEICDYSFSPPDRRYETDFFLPDFTDKCDKLKNILFMIDTSSSMSIGMLTTVYSELYGAIMQFDGNIEGKLGFFDAEVVEPVPFTDPTEFKKIEVKGGGGTSFQAVFDYIKENMLDELPTSLVILTDGYADFPDIKETLGIPVLWIITYVDYINLNGKVEPPWGKTVYIAPPDQA